MTETEGSPEIIHTGEKTDIATVSNSSPSEQVKEPTKLIRIASMVRHMLEEVRRASLDEAGRQLMADIHKRSIRELEDILSPDLQHELEKFTLPFKAQIPSESELRIAQAQLVGWLEGLFHGIQATMFSQQAAATAQFELIKRQGELNPGAEGSDTGVGYL